MYKTFFFSNFPFYGICVLCVHNITLLRYHHNFRLRCSLSHSLFTSSVCVCVCGRGVSGVSRSQVRFDSPEEAFTLACFMQ